MSGKGLNIINPTSMVAVASLAVEQSELDPSVPTASIEVQSKAQSVEIIVKSRNRLLRAKGKITARKEAQVQRPILSGKSETALGQVTPAEKTEQELIAQALKRYVGNVKHCGDKAKRSHWTTDDHRFYQCLCPIADRWRLPKVQGDVRHHHQLLKKYAGFSITVTPKGRVKDCRVWAGKGPPKDEAPKDGPKPDEPGAKP
ncbi:MAG: hypothetical protein R3C68_11160 [Myxococcota bacterium]